MRLILAAALAAAPLLALSAQPAAAYCDPRYRPLCVNECSGQLPDPRDPLAYLSRVCPD